MKKELKIFRFFLIKLVIELEKSSKIEKTQSGL